MSTSNSTMQQQLQQFQLTDQDYFEIFFGFNQILIRFGDKINNNTTPQLFELKKHLHLVSKLWAKKIELQDVEGSQIFRVFIMFLKSSSVVILKEFQGIINDTNTSTNASTNASTNTNTNTNTSTNTDNLKLISGKFAKYFKFYNDSATLSQEEQHARFMMMQAAIQKILRAKASAERSADRKSASEASASPKATPASTSPSSLSPQTMTASLERKYRADSKLSFLSFLDSEDTSSDETEGPIFKQMLVIFLSLSELSSKYRGNFIRLLTSLGSDNKAKSEVVRCLSNFCLSLGRDQVHMYSMLEKLDTSRVHSQSLKSLFETTVDFLKYLVKNAGKDESLEKLATLLQKNIRSACRKHTKLETVELVTGDTITTCFQTLLDQFVSVINEDRKLLADPRQAQAISLTDRSNPLSIIQSILEERARQIEQVRELADLKVLSESVPESFKFLFQGKPHMSEEQRMMFVTLVCIYELFAKRGLSFNQFFNRDNFVQNIENLLKDVLKSFSEGTIGLVDEGSVKLHRLLFRISRPINLRGLLEYLDYKKVENKFLKKLFFTTLILLTDPELTKPEVTESNKNTWMIFREAFLLAMKNKFGFDQKITQEMILSTFEELSTQLSSIVPNSIKHDATSQSKTIALAFEAQKTHGNGILLSGDFTHGTRGEQLFGTGLYTISPQFFFVNTWDVEHMNPKAAEQIKKLREALLLEIEQGQLITKDYIMRGSLISEEEIPQDKYLIKTIGFMFDYEAAEYPKKHNRIFKLEPAEIENLKPEIMRTALLKLVEYGCIKANNAHHRTVVGYICATYHVNPAGILSDIDDEIDDSHTPSRRAGSGYN